jgi:hypothetical protein
MPDTERKQRAMHKGYRLNDYHVVVSVHECEFCGSEFTVCPAQAPDVAGWEGCLGEGCESYDESRDFDLFFDDPERWRQLHPQAELRLEPIPED